jgi:hypothetical protein
MRVQLLYFPGCPHVERAREAIRAALAAVDLLPVFEEVDTTTESTPPALAKWGSPTVLIDGRDAAGAQPSGVACRLYDGGAPSTALVLAAIRGCREETN